MSIKYNFAGKVALITGSSSGIGAQIARMFAQSGAQGVVVTGRNARKVTEIGQQCRQFYPPIGTGSYSDTNDDPVLEIVADLNLESDMRRLADTTVHRFGRIDILVNNAGFSTRSGILEDNYVRNFRSVYQTNLDSVVYLTHYCLKFMCQHPGTGSCIVNISSVRSTHTRLTASAYCMAKAALDMFTKCMAAELGPLGIRVNSVNPGTVVTNFASVGATDGNPTVANKIAEQYEQWARVYPIGRPGQPSDIASAVLYLASQSAEFLTGTLLVADGGHLAANAQINY